MSYITPAVEYLYSNRHLMTDEGLEFVFAKGADYRLKYLRVKHMILTKSCTKHLPKQSWVFQ
ncbi:MAG: hypothetical protein OXF84_09465 [Bacteroidetes bacterium]|nr:hypothetical protein [Bacteroidota bacterium]